MAFTCTCFRQALKYYERNDIDETHVMMIPVDGNTIISRMEKYIIVLFNIDY